MAGDLTGSLTFDGSAESDGYFRITGSSFDDVLTGGDGNDQLTGGTGNDTFNVNAGTDSIADLSGSDILKVANGATANAQVTANFIATSATQNLGGTNINAVISAVTDANTGSTLTIDLTNATVTTASTDGFNIVTTNNAQALTLTGSAGDDIIIAGNIDTTNGAIITGAAGNDLITLGAGADTVNVDAGTDTVGSNTAGNSGLSGSDVVKVSNGAALNGYVTANWTATSATQNLGSVNTDATLNVVDSVTSVSLAAATVTTAATDGFTIVATNDAVALTVVGSTGSDIIQVDNADNINGATVTGGAGADVITLGAGTDTIVRNGDGTTDGTDTVNSFTAGTDIIDFTISAVTDAGGAGAITVGGFALQANADNTNTALTNGLTVIDNNDGTNVSAASLSTADVATYLADTDGAGANTDAIVFNNAGDKVYIVVSDGQDSALFLADGTAGANATTAIEADDLIKIATLVGIGDAGTLTAADFA